VISSVCNGDLNVFLMSCAHLHSQNGSMAYDSMFVQCSIDISCVDGGVELVHGDLVFLNE
jgi:hypothetical protein